MTTTIVLKFGDGSLVEIEWQGVTITVFNGSGLASPTVFNGSLVEIFLKRRYISKQERVYNLGREKLTTSRIPL